MTAPVEAFIARPGDADVWLRLLAEAHGDPLPAPRALYDDALPELVAGRLLLRQGATLVGRCELVPLGRVMELRDFYVRPPYWGAVGAPALAAVVAHAAGRGAATVTAEYPAAYAPVFQAAGFAQNVRTRMRLWLADWTPAPVRLPAGVTLRAARMEDEPVFADLAYRNYAGTADGGLVSEDRAQATVMMRATFGGAHSRFEPGASLLAEDAGATPVGGVLVGDSTQPDEPRLIWILDISLAPAWRGQGLGRALLSTVLNRARDAGFVHAGLMVTLSNAPAAGLYRALGFRDYGELLYEGVLRLPT
jgi:ribosomal protein S18 acetylase RimI-like enzyme